MRSSLVAVLALSVMMAGLVPAGAEPITPTKKTVLWNGKDFTGWKILSGPKKVRTLEEVSVDDAGCPWSVKDGEIQCKGVPPGYIRTEAAYTNYRLHVEWRWPEGGGNSGVLVHMSGADMRWPKSIECQLMANNAGDFFVIEGTEFKEHIEWVGDGKSRRTPKRGENSEKPLGEWNKYDIVCRDNTIAVYVNGVLKNKATETSVTSGRICLQSEGKPIRFRNVYIEPLD